MIQAIKEIIVGIITWAICSVIQIALTTLKRSFDGNSNDNARKINKRGIILEYYISLAAAIACFIISSKIQNSYILHIAFVVVFFISVFFNWCAFECLKEAVKDLANGKSGGND